MTAGFVVEIDRDQNAKRTAHLLGPNIGNSVNLSPLQDD